MVAGLLWAWNESQMAGQIEEAFVEKQYVEYGDRGYWISSTRVSLESVIFAFLDGLSPETIATECFPVLSLEQVYGAITYYLSHRREIDTYLQQVKVESETFQQDTSDSEFSKKMAEARRKMQLSST